jgi:NAD(P)-dependent dehydrogenase (short-subunit alcohol dehydrogenase family)
LANEFLSTLFDLTGQTAVITGGTGVLGSAMAKGLASAGAKVAIMGRRAALIESVCAEITAAGGEALALPADVLNAEQLQSARERIMTTWGRVDILVNAAGGNVPGATVAPDQSFFNVPLDAMQQVTDLNWVGTLLPTQVFGEVMSTQRRGCIINISSMAAMRAITRVVGYAAAKAAVDNFTKWLAVELAQKYGDGLRVNAIAPGFFIGDQNRRLLLNEDNSLTARGQTIINNTPARRFGEPDELISTLIWLCGPGARFITGVIIPVDGGFSSFSGV